MCTEGASCSALQLIAHGPVTYTAVSNTMSQGSTVTGIKRRRAHRRRKTKRPHRAECRECDKPVPSAGSLACTDGAQARQKSKTYGGLDKAASHSKCLEHRVFLGAGKLPWLSRRGGWYFQVSAPVWETVCIVCPQTYGNHIRVGQLSLGSQAQLQPLGTRGARPRTCRQPAPPLPPTCLVLSWQCTIYCPGTTPLSRRCPANMMPLHW